MDRDKGPGQGDSGGPTSIQKVKKVKPPYNLGGQIRSAMRKLWLFHPVQREVRNRDKIERKAMKADGTEGKAKRVFFLCAVCGNEYPQKETQVDHITPVGPTPGSKHAGNDVTWDKFVSRLFCPASGLRVVCKPCHDNITKAQTKARWEKYNNAG